MPAKLDQSLDQIMKDSRPSRNTARPRRRPGAKVAVAPTGGVAKKTKQPEKGRKAQPAQKAAPTGPAARGESKVQVSNLPQDVSELQIKEYFTTTVGAVKKVLLSYGPDGRSRGIATISFSNPDSAAKAGKELNGLKVDNRPMKIEILLGAKAVPATAGPKSLSDRVQKPADKPKPKSAAAAPKAAAGAQAGKKGRPARKGGRPAGRGKPKTAEELDAEMADYWGDGTNGLADAAVATNGGAVQPTASGDVGMEEDVIA